MQATGGTGAIDGAAALDALAAGGKAALARALNALETGAETPGVIALLDAALDRPRGVSLGLTGPPGVGKSTLTNALVPRIRARGLRLGIIAVDPSSRRSGGALLGDRTRMTHDPEDAGIFMRSMAARDRLGGVAEVTYPAMVLMRALFDIVIVETVGVGQSETEIAELADLTIFCAQPGAGDALQFMKAGVMEIPDLVLVTKGDSGTPARRTASDLAGALSLSAHSRGETAPPVEIVSATEGTGLDAALDRIAALSQTPREARRRAQAAAWLESQIRIDFGRFGLNSLGNCIKAEISRPFSLRGQMSQELRKRLENAG